MDNSRRRPNAANSNNCRGRPSVGSIPRSWFSVFANIHCGRRNRITGPYIRNSSPESIIGHLPGSLGRRFVRAIVHFHPDDAFNSPIVVYFPLLPPQPDTSGEFHSVPVFSGPFPVNHIPGLYPLLGVFNDYPVVLGPFLLHNIPYISGSIPIYHVPYIPGPENVPHCPVLYEADENDPNSTDPGYSIVVPVPYGAIPAVQLYIVPSDLMDCPTHLIFQHGYIVPPTNHILYLNAPERRDAREDLAQVSCADDNPRGPSEDLPIGGIRNGRQEAPNHPVVGMRIGRQETPNSPVLGMRIGRQETPNSPVLGMRIGRQETPNSPVLGMRIGRQERPNSPVLGMRIGRQERPNSPVLGMRIGRQETPNSPAVGMRIGRQETPNSPVLGMRIGRQETPNYPPVVGMRIGRQERPNSPVLGMRIGRQETPNSPAVGMRIGRQETPNSPVLGMRIGRQERPNSPVIGMRIGRQERPNSPVLGMRIGRQERPNSPVVGMRIGRQETPNYPPVVGMRIGRQGAPMGVHRGRGGMYNPVVQSEGFVQNLTYRYSGASGNFRGTGTGRRLNGRENIRGSQYFRNRGVLGRRPLHSCGSNDPAHDCLWDQPQRRKTSANRAGRQPTKPPAIMKPSGDVGSAGAKPKKTVDASATKQEMQPTAVFKAPKKTKKTRNDKPDGSAATSQPTPKVTIIKPPRKTKDSKIDIDFVNRAIFRVLSGFEEGEYHQSQGSSMAAAPEDPIPEDEVPKKKEKPKKSAAKKANKEDSGEGTTNRRSRYRPSYNYLRNPKRDDSSDTEEVKIRKYDEHGNRVPTYRQAVHYCTKYHEAKTRKKLRQQRREGEIAPGGQGGERSIVDDWLGDCTTTESDSDSSFLTDEGGDQMKPPNAKEMMAYYYEIKALKEEEKKKKKEK